MGMDLKPLNPSKDAPINDYDGKPQWGRYNTSGWSYLWQKLNSWGVDTSELSGYNDGDEISAETCGKIADAIEANAGTLDEQDRDWLMSHVPLWRTCGGYAQF